MLEAWLTAIESREVLLRLSAFALVFASAAVAEAVRTRRVLGLGRRARWPGNLGLTAVNAVVIRIAIPITAVGVAVVARENGVGLLNHAQAPKWVSVAVTLLVMDLTLYAQHRLFHTVPFLWRLHRVHHADLDVDITTGARFHTFEIAISLIIKAGVTAVLGAPPAAVILFEILLNATSMFNHANLELPVAVDRATRAVIVTPDMHRIHHSIEPDETNSNFGFNLTWWDYLFSTYRDDPRAGHEGMTLGVADERAPDACARLSSMLRMPFDRRVVTPDTADRVR